MLEPIRWRQIDQWPTMVRATRPGRLLPSTTPTPPSPPDPAGVGTPARGERGPTPASSGPGFFDEDLGV